MAWTNILSRRLNVEVINLGFSGSGKGEPEVAEAIAEIPNPACYILDYEANAGTEGLKKTLAEFVRILRRDHPKTPILVLSRVLPAADLFFEAGARDNAERRDFQRATVLERRKAGDANIFFIDGAGLMGTDFEECTVDGAHPTDLGFMRIADGLTAPLRMILGL
jgi:lysophospholipase L1-like esterase